MNPLADLQPLIEQGLKQYAWPNSLAPKRLTDAMTHALLAGGKRLRPALVLLANEAFGGQNEKALPAAVAWELVHTYSLIHDDLPAMDDDDLRRGQPTVHVAFDEATAILAGDAMLTEALMVLAREFDDPELSCGLIRLLGEAGGLEGMVGGQQDDLDAEGRTDLGLEDLRSIHARKTGALIASALVAGAMCAGADQSGIEAMWAFGKELGQAFQIADDILDIVSSDAELGKTVGKDAEAGKLTYPALMGLDGARQEAAKHRDQAIAALSAVPSPDKLKWLATFVVERTN